MEELKVEGLLLCSKCDNQLQVEKYKGGYGFFSVKPCTHCFLPSRIDNTDAVNAKIPQMTIHRKD